jgi:hypothetical protein
MKVVEVIGQASSPFWLVRSCAKDLLQSAPFAAFAKDSSVGLTGLPSAETSLATLSAMHFARVLDSALGGKA